LETIMPDESTTDALLRHGLTHREAGHGGRVITRDGGDVPRPDGRPLKLTCGEATRLVAALDTGADLDAAILALEP
jgi:hypothetical protein